ncbi:phosphopantetheine-binding protein [Acinetobacter chinensis]|uniref:Phosphopantetheine-binding protein n=1 Tax=Acinetobacter chinensis TaxID=2004650 RepID=A0ABU3WE48_9GAMM|nr:phosphopantetheine-binding protein [Acinetobacter chinensis]MDV2468679.1 phosphopantetheine-binding protein [Acinetobacter chinensis]
MFYTMPKKIQLSPSLAKWTLFSEESVLLVAGLNELRLLPDWEQSELNHNMLHTLKRAKALEIPVVDYSYQQDIQSLMQLGERMTGRKQLIISGLISPQLKPLLSHLKSITDKVCLVDDAIQLANQEQHIQWVENMTQQHVHHMNSHTVARLWSLSAPKEKILSYKGILLAVAEQLEIDPETDLRQYGLDSVAMVSLIGLWRANGAGISYEDFEQNNSLRQLFHLLKAEF